MNSVDGQFKSLIMVDVPENQFAWSKTAIVQGVTTNIAPERSTNLNIGVGPAPAWATIVHPNVENNWLYINANGLTFEVQFKTNMKWSAFAGTSGSQNYAKFVQTETYPTSGISTDINEIHTLKVLIDPRGVREYEGDNIYKTWRHAYIAISSTDPEVSFTTQILQIWQAPVCRVGFFDYRNPAENPNPDYPYLPKDITVGSDGASLTSIDIGALAVTTISPVWRDIVSTEGPYTLSISGAPTGADVNIHDPGYWLDGNSKKGVPTKVDDGDIDTYQQIDITAPYNDTGSVRTWTVKVTPILYAYNTEQTTRVEWASQIPAQDTVPAQALVFDDITMTVSQDSIPVIHLAYNGQSSITANGALSGYLDVSFTGGKSQSYPWEFTASDMKNQGEAAWSAEGNFDEPGTNWTFGWCHFPEVGNVKEGNKLYFEVDSNNSGQDRTAEYKVRLNQLGYPNTQEAIVTVTQAADDGLYINWDSSATQISDDGETRTLTVSATGATAKSIVWGAYKYNDANHTTGRTPYSGITFSTGESMQINSPGTYPVIATFAANNIAKPKYLRIEGVKRIGADTAGTTVIDYNQNQQAQVARFEATLYPNKDSITCGNLGNVDIEFTYRANFDFRIFCTFDNTSSSVPGSVVVTDDNWNTTYTWSLHVLGNTLSSSNKFGYIGLGTADGSTQFRAISLTQYGITNKVGIWEQCYETGRNDGGEATTDTRTDPPYSNSILASVELPESSVSSSIPLLVSKRNVFNDQEEAIGLASPNNKFEIIWEDSEGVTTGPSNTNGWCTLALKNWNVPSEISDGIYEPTTLVNPDIDNAENWPNIGISCTSNPNSTKRITTIRINPYDTSAVTPDYGTNASGNGVMIDVTQRASIPISDVTRFTIVGNMSTSSQTPLQVFLYGYSAEGEVNTINQLPVAVYALVEFVGGSTTTGLLIGTNASYLYDPSPAVANPTIAAIAFSENGPFQDGIEYITTLDWNGKTISLG